MDNEMSVNQMIQVHTARLTIIVSLPPNRFEALEKSGVTILEGDLLQEALSGRSEEEVTDEDLEAEIEQLRSRKEQLLAGKQNSIRQLNQLK